MRVKCLAQEHNTMSRPGLDRTRIARPGGERPNHDATALRWVRYVLTKRLRDPLGSKISLSSSPFSLSHNKGCSLSKNTLGVPAVILLHIFIFEDNYSDKSIRTSRQIQRREIHLDTQANPGNLASLAYSSWRTERKDEFARDEEKEGNKKINSMYNSNNNKNRFPIGACDNCL